MAQKDPPEPCVRCAKLPGEKDKYCTGCGAPLVNRCFDEHGPLKKGCNAVNDRDAAYCAKCGEPTLFNLFGLLPGHEHSPFGDSH
ncbi:hypothetical protein [Cohnella sp. REN36]|uniref:hypothetical protein n=1 Tax=Cohnella sp. REN36 TaxID=2887347 RepID=UPI001D1587F2|nr:hypothetical protein [Cohnella sp. REN36]MCC3373107.1 hypothetical protein [Cohnella sp. REN36]